MRCGAGWVAGAFVGACMAGSAAGGLVLDQQGPTSANSGFSGVLVQSFRPAADNVAAVDMFIGGTAAFDADVTVGLYATFDGETPGGLLASASLDDVPRNTLASVEWAPVAVVPEQTYFLVFDVTNNLGVSTFTGDGSAYDRGQIWAGGTPFATSDAVFATYSDDEFVIPAPGAATALLLVGAVARRRRQA